MLQIRNRKLGNPDYRDVMNSPQNIPSHDAISNRARGIWESSGQIDGRDLENWFRRKRSYSKRPAQIPAPTAPAKRHGQAVAQPRRHLLRPLGSAIPAVETRTLPPESNPAPSGNPTSYKRPAKREAGDLFECLPSPPHWPGQIGLAPEKQKIRNVPGRNTLNLSSR